MPGCVGSTSQIARVSILHHPISPGSHAARIEKLVAAVDRNPIFLAYQLFNSLSVCQQDFPVGR